MPISRREFQVRIDDPNNKAMKVLYDFWAAHRDLAYSRDELGQHAELLPLLELRERILPALETLVAVGAIEKRFVRAQGEGEEDYYAFAQEMSTEAWTPKKQVAKGDDTPTTYLRKRPLIVSPDGWKDWLLHLRACQVQGPFC